VDKRDFLTSSSAGLAGILAAGAAPTFAQALPELKWRMTTSWPKTLDTLFGGAEVAARRTSEITSGKFSIRVFAAGELVPGLQVVDAVQAGTVECGHTATYYYVGKDPTFTFGTGLPFGLSCRQISAWWMHGGGEQLMNEFLREFNAHALLCGNTGAQMAGWYRKEIKSVADLNGLKLRIGGFAGQILTKLGVVPQQVAGGEIYQALERGTIDAAEWVGPYDDEKLGFAKVAKFYYYPGWWEPGSALHLLVNLKQWEALPKEYKAALEAACHEANTWMIARYDTQNPTALRRLVAGGAQLRAFPKPVLDACYKAARELYEETAARNPKFKKVLDSVDKFQRDETLWFRVAEASYDNYIASAGAAPASAKTSDAPKS
jgi:TRAP-type mannitol/chloroaromatic compound transport system substrate-binding protein